MKIQDPNVGPHIVPVDPNGVTWAWVAGGGGLLLVLMMAGAACWLRQRRHAAMHHKLGGKRGPDKALVFQPTRRATAVRSPGAATHYLRKSPSPTAPQPPSGAGSPPNGASPNTIQGGLGVTSPKTPVAPPSDAVPLSKELCDATITEKIKVENEVNDGQLGELNFRLKFDADKNGLVVSVVSCRSLPEREADVSGGNNSSGNIGGGGGNAAGASCDPYVKLQLLPDKQHKVKTRVVRKTRNPVYDEDFTFYGLSSNQLPSITLHFVVLCFDRYSRDAIIGEVVFPLASAQLQDAESLNFCQEIQPRSLKMRAQGRGELLVSLCWQPGASRLTVVLLKARNLPKMDVTGLADPYVKMYLMYNGQRIAKKKTHVKKRTLNPVYNESFVFEVPVPAAASCSGEQLANVSLELLVLDWDRVTKNEVIGRLELGANGVGSARHHWREMGSAPRRQIADWHKLKERSGMVQH